MRWNRTGHVSRQSLKKSAEGAGGDSQMTPTEQKRTRISKLWVPIVLLLGTTLGGVLSLFIPAVEPFRGFGFRPFNEQPILQFHVILSTIEVALLIALAVVYVRIFIQTKANFAFGLVVVLYALLVHSLLQNPLLLGLVEPVEVGPYPFLPFADIFTFFSYSFFLYLSLE